MGPSVCLTALAGNELLMSNRSNATSEASEPTIRIALRDPTWAALLGWLWPGAGHIYQRRYAKGILFMVCILTTYFYGLGLGHGHVVYASWRPNDYRWQYFCQLGTGLPAVPAMVQSVKVRNGGDPFFITNTYDAAEEFPHMGVDEELKEGFMAPPPGKVYANDNDVLGEWHDELKHRFEIGTLYTVVAGLLNLLAVYDAFAGPALLQEKEDEEDENSSEGSDGDSS